MNKTMDVLKESIPYDTFTGDAFAHLFPGSPDRRYGLIKRAMAQGDLIQIRRGLYTLAAKHQRRGTNLFELAQKIYGPSYISFESALAFHGWIPEAVYTITSACLKRSREFHTPVGIFSYTHILSDSFYAGVERVESPDGIFLMAHPWKALADYVCLHKKDWIGLDPLEKDLRIERAHFKKTDLPLLNELLQNCRNLRVQNFLKSIKEDLSRL